MTGTMRVAVYHNNRDVRVEERPVPTIGPFELLVKVRSSGICGSDVLEWYRVPKAPVVLGHEIAGEVAQVGEEVQEWKVGHRVVVSHHVPCLQCGHCAHGHETVCETLRRTNVDPGGFAEYIRVPEINVRHGVFRLPDNLSWEEGTFIEPLACAVRAQRAANLGPGDTVLVLGSGIAGLLHIRLARARGAARVLATDVQEFRLKAAKGSGADFVWSAGEHSAAKLKESNRGSLANVVIVCTGAPSALEQAFASVAPGGAILFFAPTEPGRSIPVPFNDLWRNEVTMTSTYGAAPRDMRESLALLETRRISVPDLVTHRLPLDRAGDGFALVADGRASIKVVLQPNGPDT